MNRYFEPVEAKYRTSEGEALMPLRATKTSAGYDFYAVTNLVIKPQEQVLLWSDIRVKMPKGEFLALVVPSSVGVKKHCMLANTLGVVDQDYYNNEETGGNIGICLRNTLPDMKLTGYITAPIPSSDGTTTDVNIPVIKDLTEDNTVVFKVGDKVAQGIFLKHETSDNCNGEEVRRGGFGSTNKN